MISRNTREKHGCCPIFIHFFPGLAMRRPLCTLCCCGLLLATQHTASNAWKMKGGSLSVPDGDGGREERSPLTGRRRRLHSASTNEASIYSWEQREPAIVVKEPMGGGLTRAFDQAFNDAATAKVARSRLRTDCRKPRKKEKGGENGGEYYSSKSGNGYGGHEDERYNGDSFGDEPVYTPPDVYYPAPSPVADGYTPDYPAPSPHIVDDAVHPPVFVPMPTADYYPMSPPDASSPGTTQTNQYTHTHDHIHWVDGVRYYYHSHPHTHTYTVVYGSDNSGAEPDPHYNNYNDPIYGAECGGDYEDHINPDYMMPPGPAPTVPIPTPMPVDDPANRPIFVPTVPTGDDQVNRPVFMPTAPIGDDPVSRPVFVPTDSAVAPTEDGINRPTSSVVTPTMSTITGPVASPVMPSPTMIIDPTMSTITSPVGSPNMPSPTVMVDPTMSTITGPGASPNMPSPTIIVDPTISTITTPITAPVMPSPTIIVDPTMSTITTPIAAPSPTIIVDPTMSNVNTPIAAPSPTIIVDPTMSTITTPMAAPSPTTIVDPTMSTVNTPIAAPSPTIIVDPTMSTINTPIAAPSPTIMVDPTMSNSTTPLAAPVRSPSTAVISNPTTGNGMQPLSSAEICAEYRAGTAPITGNREEHSLFVVLNVDATAEEETVLDDLATALQTKVGPSILGCGSRRKLLQQQQQRILQQGSQITNINFAQPVRDATATCTQALADSKCIPVQVNATVFYNGSQPPGVGAKLRQALFLLPAGSIKGFQGWGEIDLVPEGQEPGNTTTVDNGNPPLNDSDENKGVEAGRTSNSIAFIAAAAASLVAILAALFLIRRHRKQSEKGTVVKVREFTDHEDDLGVETNDESFDAPSDLERAAVVPRKKMVYVLNDEFSTNDSVNTGLNEAYKNIRPSPYETTNSPGTRFIVADIFHEKSRTASSSRNYTANDTVQL